MRQDTVYELFSTDATPLYVGSSSNLRKRLQVHRRDKPWWPDVAFMATHAPMDHLDALDLERQRIGVLMPKHNTQSNPAVNIDRGSKATFYANRPHLTPPRQVLADAIPMSVAANREQALALADEIMATLAVTGYRVTKYRTIESAARYAA